MRAPAASGADRRAPAEVVRDGAPLGLAVATAAGAWWSVPIPLAVAIPLAVVAAALASVADRRRPLRPGLAVGSAVAALVGFGCLASSLGAHAWAGLVPPAPAAFAGEVTLTRDPGDAWGGVRAEARGPGGHRCELVARRAAAGALRHRSAGERVVVRGRLEPADEPWLAVRHVACRLEVDEVVGWAPGHPAAAAANQLRAALVRGAGALPRDLRGLFAGFVLGDTRDQPVEVADDFRAAGLTHLLAVSGQNVSLVLASASPLLTRLELRPRLAATLALLAFFALVTRFEPSVLRATAMAGLAAAAATVGRPASGARLLAGAVTVLVLVDPFLVRSVGFALSVAASAGILAAARPIAEALPGPGWLARPLGVVVAAQLGVAPVLIPVFGGLPVASFVANLLVGPVAGLVMVWGATAGLVAGVLGGAVATVAHLPTRAALTWVAGVARWAADLPLGELDGRSAVALAAGVLGALLAHRSGRRRLAALALATAVGAAAWPAVAARAPQPPVVALPGVGELWSAGGGQVLVLDGRARPEATLEAVRPRARRALDLVVAPAGGPGQAATLAVLATRVRIGEVWAPADHVVAGAVTPPTGTEARVAGLAVRVVASAPRLAVEVGTGAV